MVAFTVIGLRFGFFRDGPLEKLWGGGGGGGAKYKKKNSCKGKLSEKKIHACRVDQEKIPALAFHTFCTNLQKAGMHTVYKTSAL